MKLKTTILITIAIALAVESNAVIILSLTQSNKGLFGYDRTEWGWALGSTTPNGNHNLNGWVGTCSDPGFIKCRPPGMQTYDATDATQIETFLTFADDDSNLGNTNGSLSRVVKVDGEALTRVYTLNWTFASDKSVILTIERDDIK